MRRERRKEDGISPRRVSEWGEEWIKSSGIGEELKEICAVPNMLHSAGATWELWEMEWLHTRAREFNRPRNLALKISPPPPPSHFSPWCSPSLHPRSSSQLGPLISQLPSSLSPLSPSLSLSPAPSLPCYLCRDHARSNLPDIWWMKMELRWKHIFR